VETVIVRVWTWSAGAVAPGGVRGIARFVRTGEEVVFSDADELVAALARWSIEPPAESPPEGSRAIVHLAERGNGEPT
jgi:hypothetical protein